MDDSNHKGRTDLLLERELFNEEDPIINELNGFFDKAYELFNPYNTQNNTRLVDDAVDLYISPSLRRRQRLVCRHIANRKLFIKFRDSNKEVAHSNKKTKLISHHKILTLFWNFCQRKLIEFIRHYLKFWLRYIGYDMNFDRATSGSLYQSYLRASRTIEVIISYVYDNYRAVIKGLDKNSTFAEYQIKIFLHEFIQEIPSDLLEKYVGHLFHRLLISSCPYSSEHEPTRILRDLYVENATINNKTIKQLFFEKIIDVNFTTQSNKRKEEDLYDYFLIEQFQLVSDKAYQISPSFMNEAMNHLITNYFLGDNIISKLFHSEHLRKNMESYDEYLNNLGLDTEKKKIYMNNSIFHWLKIAYESRSMGDHLKSVVRSMIFPALKEKYEMSKNIAQFSIELRNICEVFSGEDDYLCLLKEMVYSLFGGELKAMEWYVKLIEYCTITPDNEGNSGEVHFGLPKILEILKLRPIMLDLYIRILFRRFLIDGFDKFNIDRAINKTQFLGKFYKNCHEIETLNNLFNELNSAKHINSKHEWTDNSLDFVPIILERSKIPNSFKNGSNETVNLPTELKDKWDLFEKTFKEETRNGDMMVLRPALEYQHCEVTSNFEYAEGKRLTFVLTIFQTCVLDQFNNKERISFAELTKNLNVNPKTLQMVLKSFKNVGLLELDEETKLFYVNDNFKVDPRRLKNGKLRIPLPKIVTKASKTTLQSSMSSQHSEGLRSTWRQEVLKACIVRSLKGKNKGLSIEDLQSIVEKQMEGFSVGEFKDAIESSQKDHYIKKNKENMYVYF